MLEWLTGDPLSGILTTIFFFVFLIVGRKLALERVKKTKSVTN